jgi:alkylhydroperoxidase/carboxymuconolactone decarboxylase family protein YurZ
MSPKAEVEQLMKRLAEAADTQRHRTPETTYLDPRTRALVAIGAAACTDAPTKTFQVLVGSALQAGATSEEVVGALLAVAPAAGEARVVTVAPKIALALGYDVDAAFELE